MFPILARTEQLVVLESVNGKLKVMLALRETLDGFSKSSPR
jgi:hypothetical protein